MTDQEPSIPRGVVRATLKTLILFQPFEYFGSKDQPEAEPREAILVECRNGFYVLQFGDGTTLSTAVSRPVWFRRLASRDRGQATYRVERSTTDGLVHRPLRSMTASELMTWMSKHFSDPAFDQIRIVRN